MNASDQNNISDNRTHRRMRTLKAGRAIFNGGYASFECSIKDLSTGGARLQFGDATGIPQNFELLILTDGVRKPCTVRWRRGNQIGVSFDT